MKYTCTRELDEERALLPKPDSSYVCDMHSQPELELVLVLYDITVLLVQPDHVRMPRPVVDVLEKLRDGILIPLHLTFDLPSPLGISSDPMHGASRPTLFVVVLRTQPVRLYSAARLRVKCLRKKIDLSF